jgi:hypothetical protein
MCPLPHASVLLHSIALCLLPVHISCVYVANMACMSGMFLNICPTIRNAHVTLLMPILNISLFLLLFHSDMCHVYEM